MEAVADPALRQKTKIAVRDLNFYYGSFHALKHINLEIPDRRVTAFIEDSESTAPDHSGAEGVGVDAQGNVYGAVVRRQMLERHVKP